MTLVFWLWFYASVSLQSWFLGGFLTLLRSYEQFPSWTSPPDRFALEGAFKQSMWEH